MLADFHDISANGYCIGHFLSFNAALTNVEAAMTSMCSESPFLFLCDCLPIKASVCYHLSMIRQLVLLESSAFTRFFEYPY